jgi:hypothetical protein
VSFQVVVTGLATYLGIVAKGVLQDGGDGIANLVNLRANVRSKRTKFDADAAENRLRQARSEKALEALRNTERGGGGRDKGTVAPPDTPSIEWERDRVETVSFLVQREVTRVIKVAGSPDIR